MLVLANNCTGRFTIQMMGFFFMTLFMAILAGAYYDLAENSIGGFLTLYALSFLCVIAHPPAYPPARPPV